MWNCHEYEDYFEELLLLMEKFELCYLAPEQRGLHRALAAARQLRVACR